MLLGFHAFLIFLARFDQIEFNGFAPDNFSLKLP